MAGNATARDAGLRTRSRGGAAVMSEQEHVQPWLIFLVAFDDTLDTDENAVEPYIGKELLADRSEAAAVALLRGGSVLTVLEATETEAEHARLSYEAEVLRKR
jgi:hypothetical protein